MFPVALNVLLAVHRSLCRNFHPEFLCRWFHVSQFPPLHFWLCHSHILQFQLLRQNKIKTISGITSNPPHICRTQNMGPSTARYSAKLSVVLLYLHNHTFHRYSPKEKNVQNRLPHLGPCTVCGHPPPTLHCRVCRSSSYAFFISTSCVCSFVACSNSTSDFCDSYSHTA